MQGFLTQILIVMIALLSGLHLLPLENIFASYNLSQNIPESAINLKLSELIQSTQNNISQSIQAIKSDDISTALNILSNVTLNLKEIYNGLEVSSSFPIDE